MFHFKHKWESIGDSWFGVAVAKCTECGEVEMWF